MNVQCPRCRSVYRVDPDRVPPAGVRARCSRCGEVMAVARPGAAPAPALAPERTDAAGSGAAAAAAFRSGAGSAPAAAVPAASVTPPEAAVPAASAAPPAAATPAAPVAPPVAAAPVRPEPAQPEPTLDRPVHHGREAAGAASAAASGASPRPATGGAARTGGVSRAGPRAASDPDARARRIARALVSDIVVYHKERCERSQQAGTLRTEFKDEIIKSWEEYVEQVGLELARSTPYFRDALNEILAKGQKVF